MQSLLSQIPPLFSTAFMKQLIDLEVSLHGAATLDIEHYSEDRFGDLMPPLEIVSPIAE
jgi:hypothetical protein